MVVSFSLREFLSFTSFPYVFCNLISITLQRHSYNSCFKVFVSSSQLLGHPTVGMCGLSLFLKVKDIFLVLCMLNNFGLCSGCFACYVVCTLGPVTIIWSMLMLGVSRQSTKRTFCQPCLGRQWFTSQSHSLNVCYSVLGSHAHMLFSD